MVAVNLKILHLQKVVFEPKCVKSCQYMCFFLSTTVSFWHLAWGCDTCEKMSILLGGLLLRQCYSTSRLDLWRTHESVGSHVILVLTSGPIRNWQSGVQLLKWAMKIKNLKNHQASDFFHSLVALVSSVLTWNQHDPFFCFFITPAVSFPPRSKSVSMATFRIPKHVFHEFHFKETEQWVRTYPKNGWWWWWLTTRYDMITSDKSAIMSYFLNRACLTSRFGAMWILWTQLQSRYYGQYWRNTG